MDIHAATLDPETAYKLITGIVVPRPIAWVTTLGEAGQVNLAPFSAFTFVSNKPVMIGINVGRKAGRFKDTGHNILRTGEFVAHIADDSLIEAVHHSAIEYPPEVSEVEKIGLATRPSESVKVPRLEVAPIAMECRFHQAVAFGDTGSQFMVGEVLVFHIRDDIYGNGRIDTGKLRPICRIAGPRYAKLGEIVTMAPIAQTAKTVLQGGE